MTYINHPKIQSLSSLYSGKVRDIYEFDEKHLLIVVSDRLSAFDVVFDQPIPHKGEILNQISNFWFERFKHIIPNHTTTISLECIDEIKQEPSLAKRCSIVKKVTALPVEAIVRRYIIGSGWKEYCETGSICSVPLPNNLKFASQLPEIIFTPSSKAELGQHDENISFEKCIQLLGKDIAEQMRNISITLYREAAQLAQKKGIIIADTKFEFGLDENRQLILIDEILTPDSSRFWDASSYTSGENPTSFDKQFVRDYLESIEWDKKEPAPQLPSEIITKTAEKYHYLQQCLVN